MPKYAVKLWNSLPIGVINANSIEEFKSLLTNCQVIFVHHTHD